MWIVDNVWKCFGQRVDYPQSTAFTFGAVDKLSVINTVFHTVIHSYPLVIHASKSVCSCRPAVVAPRASKSRPVGLHMEARRAATAGPSLESIIKKRGCVAHPLNIYVLLIIWKTFACRSGRSVGQDTFSWYGIRWQKTKSFSGRPRCPLWIEINKKRVCLY